MLKFICIRSNRHCNVGTWFFAEDHGEPLFQARIEGDKLVQKSHIGIPWDSLAEYIVEPGFRISREKLYRSPKRTPLPTGEETSKEVAEFQSQTEDIVEDELNRRERQSAPTVRERGGVIHLEGNRTDEGDGETIPHEPRDQGSSENPREESGSGSDSPGDRPT